MRIITLIFPLVLSGCYVGDDLGGEWGSSYSNLGQNYEMENVGLDKLKFVAEIYQSVSSDDCETYTKSNVLELDPRNTGTIGLSLKCRSATNLRRFLTVTNMNNGREIARLKFLNPKVKVSCDEIECQVTCDSTAVCLMP